MIGTKFTSKNGKVWTIDNQLSKSYVLTSEDGNYILIKDNPEKDFTFVQNLIDHQDDIDSSKIVEEIEQIFEDLVGDEI